MKHLFSFFLLCLSYLCAAQPYTIKGSISDTLNSTHLPKASVILLRASDSIMETYTRTDDNGGFELHPDTAGRYLIMITFPGFADYVDIVKVKDAHTLDLGDIPMISRSHLLKEVVFSQQIAAIKVKGDTTEYMADSFKVKDNATVEELLKRLPGIQVDKDGKIVAQGEKIEKILVDGEEFFSDDPAVVIKGLQAKTVEKVQVYDKKSDQAEFTGIDDGQKTKTLNLELKEDMKKGYFGKIDAGGGTNGYFEDQAMINAFKGKRQLSAFGIMSNTGRVGLGWADRDKFSSGNGTTTVDDEGQITTYFSGGDNDFGGWDGVYNGHGIPTVWTGGLHYADKWDEDKQHVTGNYRGAKQNVEIVENTTTQYVLPGDSQYYTKEHQSQFSTAQRHGLDAMYELKIDTSSSIKVSADAGYRNTQTSSTYYTESLTAGGDVINNNTRHITSDATQQYINADLFYRKKFAKKGRTISIDFKENYKDSKSDGQLSAVSNFLIDTAAGSLFTDQRKESSNTSEVFATKLTYTEPLSKKNYLELNYGLNINNSVGANFSYNKAPGSDVYSSFDPTYSSNFKYNILTNNGGANLRFVYDKVNFSFGTDVADSRYKQTDLLHGDTTYRYDYFNLFPKAAFNYKFGKQTSLAINYYGSTRQPTIEQIQPLRQNTDPLNVAIGNPALKQEFRNTITARYHDYKMLTGRYLWASASINFSKDAISQTTNVDSLGRRTYQYINVNGNYNAWGYAGYGFRIKKLDMDAGFNINPSINHINNYVNGVKNISDLNSYGFGLNFNKNKEKKYSIYFSPGVSYNDNRATISQYATSYWESNNELTVSVQLPMKFEIGSTVNWHIRQKTVLFDRNNNVLLWEAYASKKFLKNSQLELKVFVFDILNQNLGYNRFSQDNYVAENNYNTFTRHGMLSLVWNFTKTAGAAVGQPSTIMIK